MYENEYGSVETTQTNNPYVNPPTDNTGFNGQPYYGPDQQPVYAAKPPRKKGGIVAACIALTLVGLLVGSGVSYAYLSARGMIGNPKQTSEGETASSQEKEKAEHVGLIKREEAPDAGISSILPTTSASGDMTVEQIAEQCLPSVVAITNYSVTEIRSMWGNFLQDSTSAGSGVIIGSTDDELLVLTNYHVVENNQSLSVVFSWEDSAEELDNDEVIYASIKDYDAERDIAVISIDADSLSDRILSQISVATVGSSDDLKLGEQVVAIGNALGYGQSVTTGIVSALNRKLESADEPENDNTYIMTDAAINFGNSGGPLFNMRGELVGINRAKGGTMVENMSYAIPISEITGEVENMMNTDTAKVVPEAERGYLGVNIVDVTADISQTYGIPEGVYISSVAKGSGAEQAGIEAEDIIVAVNDKTIRTGEELRGYLDSFKVGDTVTVTVSYHNGDGYTTKDVEVTLGKRPS